MLSNEGPERRPKTSNPVLSHATIVERQERNENVEREGQLPGVTLERVPYGGSVDHFDLHGRVAIQVGTLSKAMGVLGGYVAGSRTLRQMLVQRARPFLFSTSHPPAVAAACLAAIHVLEDEPELIERLWSNTRRFKADLARSGFATGAPATPIPPIMVGVSAAAIHPSAPSLV